MDLKNAVAVCLISLFSATLVLLIARALDNQAAARLEPQLFRIAEQLEAIRQQGGFTTASSDVSKYETPDDGLVVYYFHGNTRCATCQSIESQSHATVQTHFADELKGGTILWRILNYEHPSNEELAKRFEVQMPVVVLVRMKGGQMEDWRRLDKVWALEGDKSAFEDFVRQEIAGMLESSQAPEQDVSEESVPAIPLPQDDAADIPIPTGRADIPVPD